jgi:hypothetical protein
MSVHAKRLERLERSGTPVGRLVVIERADSMSDDESLRLLKFTNLQADTLIFLRRFTTTAGLPRLISVR